MKGAVGGEWDREGAGICSSPSDLMIFVCPFQRGAFYDSISASQALKPDITTAVQHDKHKLCFTDLKG